MAKTNESAEFELLKKRLEELELELAGKKVEAKNVKTEEDEKMEAYLNEKVKVRLFKDGRDYKDPVFVAINGKNIVIERGVEVEIPRKYAMVLEESEKQMTAANEYSTAKENEFATDSAKYN